MPLPEPELPQIGQTYNIIVTGVGGTGIVTIGGILGMAAHLEGKGAGVIDMAGLAQKGGAVYSHMRIAERPEDIHAIRVAAGGADLVLGGDIVVAGNKKVLAAVKPGRTAMVINTVGVPARRLHPQRRLLAADRAAQARDLTARPARTARISSMPRGSPPRCSARRSAPTSSWSATPISSARCRCRPTAIEQAIALNGEAVPMNLAAFHWGRRAALDPRRGRGAGAAGARAARREPAAVAVVRGDGRAARRLPHRLSEQPPMRRATARWWKRRRRPKQPSARRTNAASPKRSRAICSS